MELNQAQRLFKAFRATGLCPYVAEQAVRNTEARIYRATLEGQLATPLWERRISNPSLMAAFVWVRTSQGFDFWDEQRQVQREAGYL